ncbi:MAG: cytochrome b/b6 domain-containing protein [Deltaproteobacteria bacterium]|nr:cytochrome b/b6 domain-containing protein [Deltaproteobacteria bacterium]
MKKEILLYTVFERLWHWTQMLLIFLLVITGFEVHGSCHIVGFKDACMYHDYFGWALVTLTVFGIFWHLVTGEWKQYIPNVTNIMGVAFYYFIGMFKGHPHPFQKSRERKLNPLQQVSYLFFVFLLLVQVISGVLYYFPVWSKKFVGLSLETIALVHTAVAFLMISFIIVHICMATTGPTIFTYIKSMITGREEIEQFEDYTTK